MDGVGVQIPDAFHLASLRSFGSEIAPWLTTGLHPPEQLDHGVALSPLEDLVEDLAIPRHAVERQQAPKFAVAMAKDEVLVQRLEQADADRKRVEDVVEQLIRRPHDLRRLRER